MARAARRWSASPSRSPPRSSRSLAPHLGIVIDPCRGRHHERARVRCRHRLRAAAHRALPRPAAHARTAASTRCRSRCGVRRRRSSPRRHRHARAAHPAPRRSRRTCARSASPPRSASWSPWSSACSCCPPRWWSSAAGCSGPSSRASATPPREGKFWGRIGEAVRRRPNLVGVGATGRARSSWRSARIGVQVGLSQNEQFRVKPEAVLGQETLASAFPAGATAPAAVITNPAVGRRPSIAAAKAVDGVVSVTRGRGVGRRRAGRRRALGRAGERGVLRRDPGAARGGRRGAAVPTRSSVATRRTRLDAKDARAARRERSSSRSSWCSCCTRPRAAAARRSSRRCCSSRPCSARSSRRSACVVAGVPERPRLPGARQPACCCCRSCSSSRSASTTTSSSRPGRGRRRWSSTTRDGMLTALRATGGVITSAGILLAAVFAVLGVLPLIALAQIGIIVCIGVLLDTLLVRTVLVPALAFILGERFWWPSKVDGRRPRRRGGSRHERTPSPSSSRPCDHVCAPA